MSNVFSFEDTKLRVYGTPDNPWFCGKDVCEILEYKNSKQALNDNVDDEYITILGDIYKGPSHGPLKGNMKNLKLINEQGLYCLIFNSRMKEAKKFRKWVFEEVLPTIRRNGYYIDKHISDKQIEVLKKELDEERTKNVKLEKKQLVLNEIVNNMTPMEKNQIFYIATTRSYAAQNRFKFGGVKSINDIKSRLNTYNTGRCQNDLIYICKYFECHNYRQVESRIGEVLSRFRDKQDSQKEMLFINYIRLEKVTEIICHHYNDEIDYINECCKEIFDELVDQEPFIPEPISFDDNIQISTTRNNITQTQKIDITGWSNEQFEKALIEILNVCAEAQEIKHNFETGDVKAEFNWSDVSRNIKNIYPYKNMAKWRNTFKAWYKNNNIHKLKIKGIKL